MEGIATKLEGNAAAAGIATAEEDSRHGHALGEEGRTPAGTRSISAMSSSDLFKSMATYWVVARRVRVLLVGPSGPVWRRILALLAGTRVTRVIVSLTIGVVIGGIGGHLYVSGRKGRERKEGNEVQEGQGCDVEL